MLKQNEKYLNNKSSTNLPIGIGGTLILIIFVILCLTIFATLSFVTTYSDLELSKKTAEITEDYYLIHGKSEEKLSEIYEKIVYINENLNIQYNEDLSKSNYFIKKMKQDIIEIDGVSIIESQDNSDLNLYYEILGEMNQKISVTLKILYDEKRDIPYYEIISWNLSNIVLPNYDVETYNLWEGIE